MSKEWYIPMYFAHIDNLILTKRLSVEEATFIVLRENLEDAKLIIRDYDRCKKSLPKWLGRPPYKPKNKKNCALFLRFYRAAKRDLKAEGRISARTLEMIK